MVGGTSVTEMPATTAETAAATKTAVKEEPEVEAEKKTGASEERGPPPTWLDAAFMEEALRKGGGGDLRVQDIEIDYATAPGDNYCSLIYRVKLDLIGRSNALVLLVKSLPAGEHWAKMIQEQGIFTKESITFSRVLPAMDALLTEAAPGRFSPLAARCLHHGEQPSPFIVLQDLRPEGFRMADRRKGMDLDHALLALKSLGRFHGASAALWRRRPELFERLISPFDEPGFEKDIESFEKSIADLAVVVGKWTDLPGEYGKKIHSIKDALIEKLLVVNRKRPEKFNVLIHGDFWLNNMLFLYEDDAVSDVRFIDFQLSHVGNPAIDLIIFMYTSLTEDVFDNNWDILLQAYCDALADTLELLGEKTRTMDDILNDIEEARAFIFCVCFMWLPIIRMDQGIYDMNKAAENGNWSYGLYESVTFHHWMKKLLPVFDQRGMFDELK